MKSIWKSFIKNLSKLGRAMLIPIVAMPAVGILGRLGAADMLNIPLMETASSAITANLDKFFLFCTISPIPTLEKPGHMYRFHNKSLPRKRGRL